MGKSVEEIKSYIQRKLGLGIIDVELTEDHLNDIIEDTKRWFGIRVGAKSFRQIELEKVTSVYKMDEDVIEVIRVILPTTHFPAVDTDDFSYTYSLLFGQWRSPGASPMPYSDLVQRLQTLETAQRIFSADRDWYYDHNTRELNIMPSPSILGTALVEVWSKYIETRDLTPEDEDFFLRWAVADAKEKLGNIRAKFTQYTTVAGDRGLNAMAMIQQAEKEKLRIDSESISRKRSTPFVIG